MVVSNVFILHPTFISTMDVFWAKALTKWAVCMPWARAVAAVAAVAIREMIAAMPAMTMLITLFSLVSWF